MLQMENNNPLKYLNFNLNWKWETLNQTSYYLHTIEVQIYIYK